MRRLEGMELMRGHSVNTVCLLLELKDGGEC